MSDALLQAVLLLAMPFSPPVSARMQLPEQPSASVLSADSNLRRPSQIMPDPLLQPQQMGTVPTYAMPQMQMPSPQLWGQMPQMQMPGSKQWPHAEPDSKNLDA